MGGVAVVLVVVCVGPAEADVVGTVVDSEVTTDGGELALDNGMLTDPGVLWMVVDVSPGTMVWEVLKDPVVSTVAELLWVAEEAAVRTVLIELPEGCDVGAEDGLLG